MVKEEDLTWGGEHTTQYTNDVLYDWTPEIYIILLTSVTPDKFTTLKRRKKKTRALILGAYSLSPIPAQWEASCHAVRLLRQLMDGGVGEGGRRGLLSKKLQLSSNRVSVLEAESPSLAEPSDGCRPGQ